MNGYSKENKIDDDDNSNNSNNNTNTSNNNSNNRLSLNEKTPLSGAIRLWTENEDELKKQLNKIITQDSNFQKLKAPLTAHPTRLTADPTPTTSIPTGFIFIHF